MSLMQIQMRREPQSGITIFELGFRPFFLGAGAFAVVSMCAWSVFYFGVVPFDAGRISALQWHAHEMLYGYTFAVIVGFLLTAVTNWTGVWTLKGGWLAGLFLFWCAARVLMLFGARFINCAALTDILFGVGIFVAIAHPIVRVRQWGQAGILVKIALLLGGNVLFYLAALGVLERGAEVAIYGALYVVLGLLLAIGSRVVPSFITNGVDGQVELRNPSWVNGVSMGLLVVFFVNQLWMTSVAAAALTGAFLFVINSYRLACWYTRGIWRVPLLWGLYLAFVAIDVGFLLEVIAALSGVSRSLAVHAYTVGGIGLATLSMMSRVTLGHTGRMISNPPVATRWSFGVLLVGVICRVLAPILFPSQYPFWILSAQAAWIFAFVLFLGSYGGMLIRARIDGRAG